MCYGQMADFSRKMEKYDFLGGHKLAQDIFKNDSDNVEGFGRAVGWDQLERDARWNQNNPEEGMAHAGVATLGGFLGNWLGGAAGANTGYVDQIGNAYEGAIAGQSTTGGLMGAAMSGGKNSAQAMKMMEAMRMMQQPQQQPMMPPQQPQAQPYQAQTPAPGGFQPMAEMPKDPRFETEEEKRKRLMRMGGFY